MDKCDEIYRYEILHIKALGEMIGYGNLMDIASILWAEQLKRDGFPDSGACYATIISEIKEGSLKDALIEARLQKIEYYKNLGILDDKDDLTEQYERGNYGIEKHMINKAHPEYSDKEVEAYIKGYEEKEIEIRDKIMEDKAIETGLKLVSQPCILCGNNCQVSFSEQFKVRNGLCKEREQYYSTEPPFNYCGEEPVG